jgi:perosamine synthetase
MEKIITNPRFAGNELNYVREALEAGFKAGPQGTMKERLERLFARRFSVPYAVSANSGTSPIHQALVACGVGPGEEVIVTPFGPMMPTYAIMHAGAIPVFADIDPETFLIDPADIRRKITPRTAAILVVHLYGGVADMSAIMQIARKYNIPVIEDCAQCLLGMDSEGRLAGTIGNAGTFSFDNKKHISSGEGGMLITSDEGIAERARRFGGLGFGSITSSTGNVARDLASFQNPDYKRHESYGFNYRMCEIAAAVALAQAERMGDFVERAVFMALEFNKVIKETECDWIVPQKNGPETLNAYWTFAARYDGEEKFGVSWHDFRKKFMEFGGDGIYACWQLSYKEPALEMINQTGSAFAGMPHQLLDYRGCFDQVSCPNAERLQPKMLQFTTNQQSGAEREVQASALRRTIRYFGR